MKTLISDATINEMLEVLFPKHRNKKAARTAVEFFLQQNEHNENPHADMATLRKFVDYMIEKGYN